MTNFKTKPLEWKEFRKLNKQRKIHTVEEQIKKHGILLTMEDLKDFGNELNKDLKRQLKEEFDDFLNDFWISL